MGDGSKIEWTDATWNAIRGCSAVSAGCANCYAERDAGRWSGPGMPYEGLVKLTRNGAKWTGVVRLIEKHLHDPLRWTRPRLVFTNSMSDMFHESLPVTDIASMFAVMALAPQHTFQILTKRAKVMHEVLADPAFHALVAQLAHDIAFSEPWAKRGIWKGPGSLAWPLKNVWLGVSVESQACADERIPLLLRTPAALRWLSCEPLLEAVDLAKAPAISNAGYLNVDWIVVGGESGPAARPFHLEWASKIVADAATAAVPVFMKQVGADPFLGGTAHKITDMKGKHPEDWPRNLQVRSFPEAS